MAVYTKLSENELKDFFLKYDLGKFLNHKEIKEGIENTNYFVNTEKGKFILTLYEKRVDEKDLPFFMSVMKNLYDSKFPSPQPIINKNGNYITEILNKKAAMVSFLEGKAKKNLSPFNCKSIGIEVAKMHQITKSICEAYGASYEFEFEHRYPATINSEEEAEIAGKVAQQVVGEDRVNLSPTPGMGSEDFAYMLQEKPGSYIWIGNGDGEGSCMVHNPGYDFNDEILPIGATYWVKMAEEILSPID